LADLFEAAGILSRQTHSLAPCGRSAMCYNRTAPSALRHANFFWHTYNRQLPETHPHAKNFLRSADKQPPETHHHTQTVCPMPTNNRRRHTIIRMISAHCQRSAGGAVRL